MSVEPLDLVATLESGQAFRWHRAGKEYHGFLSGEPVTVWQEGSVLALCARGASGENVEEWVRAGALRYFDLDTDYREVASRLKSLDPLISRAVEFAPGLRLLRQPPWETLISFIISANNNIPRIKRIVNRLALCYGERARGNGITSYLFPSPLRLARCSEAELRACGMGFRAPYVLEVARRVAGGALDPGRLEMLPTDEARGLLMTFPGVGRKVADCVLLFGLGKREVFPIDVWAKRGLEHLYFRGREKSLPYLHKFVRERFGPLAGYAQNYIYYYTRQGLARPARLSGSPSSAVR